MVYTLDEQSLSEQELLEYDICTYCQNTKKTYLSSFLKLKKFFPSNDIHTIENLDLINTIIGNISNRHSQHQLLNIAIRLKRIYDKNIDSLLNYRDKQLKPDIKNHVIAKNTAIAPGFPTYETIKDWIDALSDKACWRQYIINYILWNLNCRNLDLHCRFARTNKKLDPNENYLILHQKSVVFIRNKYKTKNTYGTLTNTISNGHFINACWQLTKGFTRDPEEHPYWLVTQENGDPVHESNIGYHIIQNTYNNIGEGNYLKIIMDHINRTGDITKLNMISKNRGTSHETLLSNYNCSNKVFTYDVY